MKIRDGLYLILLSLLFVRCNTHGYNSYEALDYCSAQVEHSLQSLQPHDYSMTPRSITPDSTTWNMVKVKQEEWSAGFWPGVLWYNYENNKSVENLEYAHRYTEALRDIATAPAYDHDIGFLTYCSYGNGYRLTQNESYKEVLLTSAENLSKLYNPNVGTFLSWPHEVEHFGGHVTIIDNMPNLEILFWAAENGGDKTLRDMAISHANRTMETLIRKDGSSYRVAVFNPVSGEHLSSCTFQGYSEDSMRARSQAWGIYGFAMCYRYTKDSRYIDFAQKIADVFIAALPSDMIPFWDFNDPAIPNTYRDTSAATIAASALLELSTYLPGEGYRAAGEAILESLYEDYLNGDAPALLLHAIGNLPEGIDVNHSTIYADYYYFEALMRLKRINEGKAL